MILCVSIRKLPVPPQAVRVIMLLANMPTEARTNPGTEMASINLKGLQQCRWPWRGRPGRWIAITTMINEKGSSTLQKGDEKPVRAQEASEQF